MSESAFLWMLNCTLRGGLVLFWIMICRLLVRKSSRKWCYVLWGLGAFRLLCPWTPPFLRMPGAMLPRVDWFQEEPLTGEMPALVLRATVIGDPLTVCPLPFSGERMSILLRVLSLVWLAGVAALLMMGVVSYLRLMRRLAGAEKLESESKSGFFAVYECAEIASPFAMGVFRKRIYLPPGLSPAEREAVVAHEETHLDRNDPLWKLIAYMLRSIHWMNPMVWIAFRLWGADMEYTCDERVFRWLDRSGIPEYCRALLSVSRKRLVSCPVAFSEGGIKGRVKNLLRPRKHRVLWGLLSAFLVLNITIASVTAAEGIREGWQPLREETCQALQREMDVLYGHLEEVSQAGCFDRAERKEHIDHTYYTFRKEINQPDCEGWYEVRLFTGGEWDHPFAPSTPFSEATCLLTAYDDVPREEYPYLWNFFGENEKYWIEVWIRCAYPRPNRAEEALTDLIECLRAINGAESTGKAAAGRVEKGSRDDQRPPLN